MRQTYFVNCGRGMLLAAIDEVARELAAYDGATVVADEHALHKAVVELETLCICRPHHKQNRALPSPLNRVWYRLLWASREDAPTYWAREYPDESPTGYGSASPEEAVEWARLLATYLRGFRELVSNGTYERMISAGSYSEARWGISEALNDPSLVKISRNTA